MPCRSYYKRKKVHDDDRLATVVDGRVNGNKDNLKNSQAYTREFGEAVHESFQCRRASWNLDEDEASVSSGEELDDWADAGLLPLVNELQLHRLAA